MKGKAIRFLSLALCAALALGCAVSAWTLEGGYSEGMALATDGSKWGYVNSSGTLAIPMRFDKAAPFMLGTAIVQENGKYGVLRSDGLWLLSPSYDSLTYVDSGVYIAAKDGRRDLFALDGTLLVEGADGIATMTADGVRSIVITRAGQEDERITVADLPKLLAAQGAEGAAFSLQADHVPEFSDVSGRDWFDLWVGLAYNVGLMEGPGDGKFYPYKSLTVGEGLKLAAVLDSRYSGGFFQNRTIPGKPWYTDALNYCLRGGIISESTFDNYDRPITRAEMALIFAATAPVKAAADLNSTTRVKASIPDVSASDFAASAIFSLYAKGVLSGSDKQLTFRPGAVITRSEVAAIVGRIARPEQRITLWPGSAARSAAAAA